MFLPSPHGIFAAAVLAGQVDDEGSWMLTATGPRPVSPARPLPQPGRVDDCRGGHFRYGILLAPIIAKVIGRADPVRPRLARPLAVCSSAV